MTTTAQAMYDGQDMKDIEDRVMNPGVDPDREAEILQKNKDKSVTVDEILKMYEGTDSIRDLTFKDKTPIQQTMLKLCYTVGLTSPEAELTKTKKAYDKKASLLEQMKTSYREEKKSIEEDITEEKGWVYDCDKIIEQKENEKEELEKELAYESEEVKKCKAAYKTAPSKEQKEELIEMVRGYDESKAVKETKIEQLEDDIEVASDSFNDHYDDWQDLKADRNDQVCMLRAVNKLQRGYKRVAKSYDKILKKSNKGKITDCKLIALLMKDLQTAFDAKKDVDQALKKQRKVIKRGPDFVEQQETLNRQDREKEEEDIKRTAGESVNKARERRTSLYTSM